MPKKLGDYKGDTKDKAEEGIFFVKHQKSPQVYITTVSTWILLKFVKVFATNKKKTKKHEDFA